ncbi:MAG: hypothetical protein V4582_03290 [Pseudomonadota bacterium]
MTARRMFAALAGALLLAACASTGNTVSLQEVRDFAAESTQLAGYAELSTRFRDTYSREQVYLPAAADKLAKENDAKRRAVVEDFVNIQRSVVLYMQTLGMLAGENRYDLAPRIDELGIGLRANPEIGIEPRHVLAYTGLTRLLTRVIASDFQGRSVESMVRDGDADLQTLIDAMINLLRYYAKTHANEKKTILGLFEVEIPFTNKQDKMLATLARVHYQSKVSEYKLIDRRHELAAQGLTKVALGHQKLRENLRALSGEEARKMLRDYGRDLRLIREALHNNAT